MNDIQARYEREYGPGNYRPPVGATYWTFRAMVGLGLAMIVFSAAGMVLLRRGRFDGASAFHRIALPMIAAPFLANNIGWVFTEVGRQPWAVFGLLRTADGASPTVAREWIILSIVGLIVVYTVLGAAFGWLMVRFSRAGPPPAISEERPTAAMAY